MSDALPFDVCGPLPTGTTVLEASAGTGKTFTIAALAARYVAEGHAELSQLMLVTFGRAATQELRERVRERLVSAEHGLADPAAARTQTGDALLALLAEGSDDDVRARRARLTRALAAFDGATIATTHGFCQQMLTGLGVAGDHDPDAVFVERIDDLVTEVVDDLYVRKYSPSGAGRPATDYTCARRVARDAMADPHAELVEHEPDGDEVAYQRFGIAGAVRNEVAKRKRARRMLDYDDLLTRLRDVLVDPVRGPAAAQRIRSRYQVVLVDEFQDTDPVQWEILSTCFHGHTTLVLIGDPKQAIYAFRGADLVTYLAAVREATTRRTLARNWRSDSDLLAALGTVFHGAALGHADIVVRPVEAANAARRLSGAGSPLRLRVVRRDQATRTRDGLLRVDPARELVARDVAGDIVTLLESDALLQVDERPRPVCPGDVAVLVHTNNQADLIRDELVRVGVPAVLTGSRSVFLSDVAAEWLTLLRALEQPHRAGLVRAAALTPFLGWTAQRLATSPDETLDDLGTELRRWRDVLVARGVAALVETMSSTQQLTERLLAFPNGERDLTDLRHIGQALHAAAVEGQLGPAALVEWLQRRIGEAKEDASEERSRRLESDADAVQVVTVHSSKGLEFPIVYVPFGWDRWVNKTPDLLRLHADDGTRLLDVGGESGAGWKERRDKHLAEECGENLRLLYVAMTRARCQVVTWWAPSGNTRGSALHRLLFGTFDEGDEPPASVEVPDDDAGVRSALALVASASGGTVSVEPAGDEPSEPWSAPRPPGTALAAAVLRRTVDGAWRRTSYTGLTAALHGAGGPGGAASEPEETERQDEAPVVVATAAAAVSPVEDALRGVPSPMAELPSGTAFGTLVHAVLETVDTAAADLGAELGARCAEAVAGRLASLIDPDALAAALLPVMDTPLGPLGLGHRLRDVRPADRLAELEFELPLAGGDDPRPADATIGALAALLRPALPADDPLAGYADALAEPALAAQRLRGYLTGSIDAVLRIRDREGGVPRYVVVDYKTNWLGGDSPAGPEPLTAWHYRPAVLASAMVRAHYPLQALLYSVALHRFLRWRQPGYDPAVHLGGVLYLFVRGMCGAATPVVDGVPCGVFSWRPPASLVSALSDLLDGGVA